MPLTPSSIATSTDRSINLSPDRRPSSGKHIVDYTEGNIRCVLEVKGLGALVFRVSEGQFDGRLAFEGLSTFTHKQLLIENEIDDPRLARLE